LDTETWLVFDERAGAGLDFGVACAFLPESTLGLELGSVLLLDLTLAFALALALEVAPVSERLLGTDVARRDVEGRDFAIGASNGKRYRERERPLRLGSCRSARHTVAPTHSRWRQPILTGSPLPQNKPRFSIRLLVSRVNSNSDEGEGLKCLSTNDRETWRQLKQ
jgi:hypothetical protein